MPTSPYDLDRIRAKFEYHTPTTDSVATAHQEVRRLCGNLALILAEMLPYGNERNEAIKAVDLASMHANAAIARSQTVDHVEDHTPMNHPLMTAASHAALRREKAQDAEWLFERTSPKGNLFVAHCDAERESVKATPLLRKWASPDYNDALLEQDEGDREVVGIFRLSSYARHAAYLHNCWVNDVHSGRRKIDHPW